MSKVTRAERREYPRLEQQLPLKVAANGYDFMTTTQNVSCVGAYCHISKYVPPFTKVMVNLTLPIKTDNENRNYRLDCKGVLVRTEDSPDGGFNIAIFFNDIREEERKKISEYINQFIPQ